MALKAMAVALTLFIVSANVNAVTPICNPTNDKALCSKMTKDAPTWAEAMYNAINYELARLKAGQSIVYGIGSKLPDDLEPSEKQDVINTCINVVYDGIIKDLKKGLGFIKKDPYYQALQGAIQESYFYGCVEKFEFVTHISAPADLAKFNNEIQNNNDILSILASSRPKA